MGCHFLLQCIKGKSESEVAQLCPTLSDLVDCSLPGSSVHGIFQARVLEWGAIAFSSCTLRGTKCQAQEPFCQQEKQGLQGYRENAPTQSWQGDYTGTMPVALGAINGSYQEETLYSGLSSAYEVVEANAQNTIKGLKWKIYTYIYLVGFFVWLVF